MNKKHSISAAILLLVSFWASDLLAAQYFPDDLDMPTREKKTFIDYYSNLLPLMKEPSLWLKTKDQNKISYRFIYLRVKRPREPVVLRLDRITKTKWVQTVKVADYSLLHKGVAVNRRRRMAQNNVNQFQELFTQLQFWDLPSVVGAYHAEHSLHDGTIWLLEAVENGQYHVIQRVSPTNRRSWVVDPQDQKMRNEEGYPDIDQATSEEVNRKLVAVGEYLVKLSGLKVELR